MYIRTLMLEADPRTRAEYNILRGWKLPDDENGDDKGYVLSDYAGGTSWITEAQFNKSVRGSGDFSVSESLLLAIEGRKVSRIGWNGKGAHITAHAGINGSRPFLIFVDANGTVSIGWAPSQADIFANDWFLVE